MCIAWGFTVSANQIIRAGLLTNGSHYSPRLPALLWSSSGLLRISSPFTAAGPFRIYTGFPIEPIKGTLNDRLVLKSKHKRASGLCQTKNDSEKYGSGKGVQWINALDGRHDFINKR